MATLAELRSKIQRLFGDEDEAVITIVAINDFINESIRQIAIDCELIVMTAATITTTDADGLIALPSDFLRIHSLRYNNILLPQITPLMARAAYETIEDGEPQGWLPYDFNQLQLWPRKVSGTGLDIKLRYLGYPALLSVDGNSPDLPAVLHEAIVQYSLMRSFEQIQDIQMAEYARGDYNRQIMQYNYLRNNPQIDRFAAIVDTESEQYIWR